MSIEKKYLSDNETCKVTFTLPSDIARSAKKANVVGDFNDWDTEALPMKKYKNGKVSLAIKLQSNNEYQFRYLIDGSVWHTDDEADAVVPAPYADEQNAVIRV
jgi:1,4-alpha-glucan branching enzyme